MSARILFFSRGRGYGHAIPDLAIARALLRIRDDLSIQFASYATGAQVLRASEFAFLDLGMPENNLFLPTLFKCREMIESVRPDVVVAHEEFAALPAAQMAGVPAVFISAWLPSDGRIGAEALAYAAAILVVGDPGLFPAPRSIAVKPIYVGPIHRELKYTVSDRESLREQMGISAASPVIVVLPGGHATEEMRPMADCVVSAFLGLPGTGKRLFWISGQDYDPLRLRYGGIEGLEPMPFVDPIERMLAIADVVITKGTLGTALDCAAVGVPSVSLSPELNYIDDVMVPRLPNNIALNARAVDGEILLRYLRRLLDDRNGGGMANPGVVPTAGTAAEVLSSELDRILEISADGLRKRESALVPAAEN